MRNIISAIPMEHSRLNIRFDDGSNFDIDITPFIKSGVSHALSNQQFFEKVMVENGYITWPNGYDFCPEFLYDYALTNSI